MGNEDDVKQAATHDLIFDGERFVPGAGVGIAYEHWTRYAFAQELVAGRDVLDVACGEGYGSAFLAALARSVVGFDASAEAVAHAQRTYAGSGARFQQATVRSFFDACPAGSFDVVVAFEMIEHLPVDEQALLLDGIRRVLRPAGIALISTPDKLLYTDRSLAKNPFHIREFYRDEFEAELRGRFAEVLLLGQSLFTGCAVVAPGAKSVQAVQMSWTDLLRARGVCAPELKVSGEYLVALVSQQPLPEVPSVLLADFSRKLIAEGLEAERRTADRLARELEQARRAWEGQGAEARALSEELARTKQASASEREENVRVREAAARDRAEATRDRDEAIREHEEARRERELAVSAHERASRESLAEHARAREQTAGALASLREELERAQERNQASLRDLARLHAQESAARAALRSLRDRKEVRIDRRLRAGARDARAVLGRSWLKPLSAVKELRRSLRDRQLVEQSGLFDREFYLAEQPDVAQSGLDPLDHFLQHGAQEGRDPHPLFDCSYYLETNPDVAQSGQNPLVHFLRDGWKEHRNPNALFDTAWYLGRNPDVAAAGLNPLAHYFEHGAPEGRAPSPRFDSRAYLAQHAGAAAGGFNPVEHALRSGNPAPAPGVATGPQQDAELARWRSEVLAFPRRALVVDDRVLTPDRDSGSITTLEMMKALQSLGYAVTFVPYDLAHVDRYVEALREAGFWCLTGQTISSAHALLEAHGDLFDLVMLARISTACHLVDAVRARCPRAALLFETMDLHYLRGEREAALTGSEEARRHAAETKEIELDLVRRADLTLVHSDFEERTLAREVPGATVRLFPYVLEVQGRRRGFAERGQDIVFIGGFAHRPNVDAVTTFAREVFPLVREQLPRARFVVVGSDPSPEVMALEGNGVVVTGYVENLEPVLDACRLTVAPLRYGAGYKGKVAMSMAHGVPAVISSIAAEGMGLTHEGQVLIAETGDAAGFAAAVVRVHRDAALWERLSQGSLAFVAEHFSPLAARERLGHLLRGAGLGPVREISSPIAAGAVEPGHAIFPSRFMHALHERAGVRFAHSEIVPHGVDFRHPPDAPRADRAQLVEAGRLRLLVAGRLVNFKGVHTALLALPDIISALPGLDVQLTLVGDAQDAAYVTRLRAMVAEAGLDGHVRFLPPVTEDALFVLFQKHDLYLFPSLFEPFALTLILALEAGIPTVATAAGGNVDIVTDRDTGLLFPAGDAVALAQAVLALARDGELRSELSARGRARAAQYTTEAMLARVEAALAEAARPGRVAP